MKAINSVESCQNIPDLSYMCCTITFCCRVVGDLGLSQFLWLSLYSFMRYGIVTHSEDTLVATLIPHNSSRRGAEDRGTAQLIPGEIYFSIKQVPFHHVCSHMLETHSPPL